MNQRQIGKFIAKLRNEKNITQSELGEKIGVTNKTVSRWENGNYMPDISVIPLLCTELGVSANELLCAQKLDASDFKIDADVNLMKMLNNIRIKAIKHEKSIIQHFTGAGIGAIFAHIAVQDSMFETSTLAIGITLIGIGWYKEVKHDKLILRYLGEECDKE